MDKLEKILEYAKQIYYGYDGVEYLGKWQGEKIYDPTVNVPEGQFAAIGYPTLIAEDKKGNLRATDIEETFDLLDHFSPEEK